MWCSCFAWIKNRPKRKKTNIRFQYACAAHVLHSNALRNCDAAFGNLDACKVTWWWWAWMMITTRQHWFKPQKALKLHYLAEYFENLKSTQRLPNLFQFFGNSNLVSKNLCRAFCPRNTNKFSLHVHIRVWGVSFYAAQWFSSYLLTHWANFSQHLLNLWPDMRNMWKERPYYSPL